MQGFCPLASGSKGNSIYFGTKKTKILIDAGISARLVQERLSKINVDLSDIDAILVSHDHTDHIKGLKVLACRMKIPVFSNHETAKGIIAHLQECPKFKIFSTGETFEYGDVEIHPFTVPHDTLDPVGFVIRTDDLKLAFCTDLGFVSNLVRHHLRDSDYIYVEANHNLSMVQASSRPIIYKQRVLSRYGHLSNEACGGLLSEVASPKLKKVILAHLSKECNSPSVALRDVQSVLGKQSLHFELSLALQDQIGEPIQFGQ